MPIPTLPKKPRNRKPTTFRLSEACLDTLAHICERTGHTRDMVIELMVQQEYKALEEMTHVQTSMPAVSATHRAQAPQPAKKR